MSAKRVPEAGIISPEAERFLNSATTGPGETRILEAPAIDVPVNGGSVRVYHVAGSGSGRPLVFVSGWGTIPSTFGSFYAAIPPEIDVFHVETREKPSSQIRRWKAQYDMDRFASDIRDAIDHLGIDDRQPVLMGTCFGSAVILHGLSRGILDASTIVCVDPMVRLWMPLWAILFLGSLPVFVVRILRPLIRAIVLAGMREPVQRARAAAFINHAVIWKWRKGALQTRKWNLFDIAPQIRQRVHVLNGSHDRFHHADLFPGVARAIPDGIFVRVPVGEANRERLMGAAATVFARSTAGGDVPAELHSFVVPPGHDEMSRDDPEDAADQGQLDQFDTA